MRQPYFPMFVNLSGKKVLVVGGGRIALRRVESLLPFGASVRVVAPDICEGMGKLCRSGRIDHLERRFEAGDVEWADIVLAATDDRAVNRLVWESAKKNNLPVNVADDKELCDFYFPALAMNEDLVVGVSSGGEDPARTKAARMKIEEIVKNL